MEQLTKKQVVESMYALRAGLSAISVESEHIGKTYEECEETVNQIVRNELGSFVDDESLHDGSYELSIKGRIGRARKSFIASVIKILVLLPLLIFAIVTVVNCIKFLTTCDWHGSITDAEMGRMLAGIGIAVLAVAVGVLCGVFLIRNLFNIFKCPSAIRKRHRLLSRIPSTKKEIQEIKGKAWLKITPALQACEELQKKLYELYGEWLDERDWQHIDLIIYYIETHRADSLKEALLLVEREIQTQRIINAIEQATAQICATLRQGFYAIGQAVNNLSSQLLAMQKIQSAQMANLTSAVNFNNALQAKANVTSKQLMQDVSAIRSNSDYFTARLKKAYPQ